MHTTPLHEAAGAGNPNACLEHLDAGASLEALNEWGWTPLIVAVQNDHVDVARVLIERGARLEYEYQREDTKEARQAQARSQAELLDRIGHGPHMEEVLTGIPDECRGAIRQALQEVDMVEMMTDYHFMPKKERAIGHARGIPMLTLLLAHGADLNAIDEGGYSPLSSFAETDDIKVVRWLLDQQAYPNVTSTGETPIFKAIHNDNLEMVRLFVSRGAKLDVQDVDGWSPLFLCQSLAMARYLIAHGADPTVTDQAGFPCWHWVKVEGTRGFLKESALALGLKKWTEL